MKEKGTKCIMEDEVKTRVEKKQNNGRKFKKEKEQSQIEDRNGSKSENEISEMGKKNKNEIVSGDNKNGQKNEEISVVKKGTSDEELLYIGDKGIKKNVNNENEISKKIEDMKINNRKSSINEELKKEEKRVTSLIENSGDSLNMWSSVSKILVKKNELAGKINGKNEEEMKDSVDEIKDIVKIENKESENRMGKELGILNGKTRGLKNNSPNSEIEVSDQSEISVYKNTKVYQGNKVIEGTIESKSLDKVISTQWLPCEKASELKQNIIKKFSKFNRNGDTLRWSRTGSTIEEKIKHIERQTCVFPSKKKIDEVAAFGMLINNQQKSNSFKKINQKVFEV